MSSPPPDTASALVVDLYELTMMQAYHRQRMEGRATFDLFVRRLPPGRDFLLVAGLETVLERLEGLQFATSDLEYLASLGLFEKSFLNRLENLRFSGDVIAMNEGTLAFAGEPILRVTAPIIEAQFLETVVMNQIHLQTLLASKAARVVLAAGGRGLMDFGLRRTHGAEAGLYGARAEYIAGFDATSNVLAGKRFGIPVAGTMAHSYIQASGDEATAFRTFAECFPDTILLVDTYDTLRGVERVIALADELGDDFRVRGVRLDSGDLAALAPAVRDRLDAAGLERLKIFASGNLDEHRLLELAAAGAPIDAFGIGTRLGTSQDAPNLDIVYKLAQVDDRPLLKLSTDKKTLPGVKQVWRERDGSRVPVRDVVGLATEDLDGEPLLAPVMVGGKRLSAAEGDLEAARERAAAELRHLPESMRRLEPDAEPYPVVVSYRLRALRDDLASRV
jgi:nicotinate phosphoribosyltransferase